MSNPTITVTADGATGAMVSSPTSLRTSGAVDITNNYGSAIWYIFSTSTSWPSGQSGTQLPNNNTANETITVSGYFLFAAQSGGPPLTSTQTSKTGGDDLAPPKPSK